MRSAKWHDNKYYGMTKPEIKKLWSDNGTNAAAAGTKLHFDIECFYNNMQVSNNSVEYAYFQKFCSDFNNNLIPYRTEWLIYDEELRMSGSIDMVFKNSNSSNSVDIYDWKRVKEITKNSKWNKWMTNSILSHLPDTNYWHYSLQLNIYKAILIRNYGLQVNNLYLVCLHPDNKSYICIPCPDLQSEVESLFLERKKQIV